MVSMTFSVASILKAMYDMNLGPLMKDQSVNISSTLLLSKTPFYMANVIFRCPVLFCRIRYSSLRLCSYSFIATFLDFWSLIPLGILFFVNLCICGLFFTPSSTDDTPAEDAPADEENNEDIESNGQYETDSIGWNRNIVILSPRRERPDEDQGCLLYTSDAADE